MPRFGVFQAEELNSIVGNAFRMAYAAQLQRQDATLSLGKPSNINNNIIINNNNNNNNHHNNNHDLRHTWVSCHEVSRNRNSS